MLKVKIYSFSYLYGSIPEDETVNGGGFVFDCRFIFNPGGLAEFRTLSGLDKPVIEVLDAKPEMSAFMLNVYNIVDAAVDNYLFRNFTSLMVSFGCTGGQHRSVYSAEKLYNHLSEKYPHIELEITHTMKNIWKH